MRDVLFMYTIIYHYSMKWYTPIFISSSMWFSLYSSLYFLVYACENYLSSKIYFQCFFLASLIIALELLFLHGIRAIGSTTLKSSTWYRSAMLIKFYRVEELYVLSSRVHLVSYPSLKKSLSSLQDFLLICFAGCREYLLEHINKFNMDSKVPLLSPFNYSDWNQRWVHTWRGNVYLMSPLVHWANLSLMKRRLFGWIIVI